MIADIFDPRLIHRLATCLALATLLATTSANRAAGNPAAYEAGLDPAVGFNLISWYGGTQSSDWTNALDGLHAAGFTEVSISPLRFIDTNGADSGRLISAGTPSLSGIRSAVNYAAQTLGMTVTLNPFIEPEGFSTWRANYNPSGAEATRFWSDYKSYLDEVADIAEDEGATFMTVGTELRGLAQNSSFSGQWNTVLSSVDGIFSGQLGYAANWDDYADATTTSSIWEHPAIDFMGIDAYFPVSDFFTANQDPQPDGLNDSIRAEWNNILDFQILPFADARKGGDGLPLVFTEYGVQPWNRGVRQHGEVEFGNVDTAEQIQGFDGLLQAMDLRRADDNLLAMHIWHWAMPGGDDNNWGMGLPGSSANFTPATQFLSSFVSNTLPVVTSWTSPTSGDFGVANRWTDGVPTAGFTPHFDVAGTYTVTFDSSPNSLANPVQNVGFVKSAGNVTFRSSGADYSYHLTDDARILGGTLSLGAISDPLHLTVDDDLIVQGGAALNVNFGSVVSAKDVFLDQSGGNATIVVDGTGSQLNATSSTTFGLGGNTSTLTYRNSAQGALGTLNIATTDVAPAVATLVVESNAQVTTGNIAISGGFSSSTGTISIQGAGSTLTQSGGSSLTIGAFFSDAGNVNIGTLASGATFTTGTGPVTIDTTGAIRVGSASTAGILNANSDIAVSGSLTLAGGTVNAHAALAVQPGGSFNFAGGTLHATSIQGSIVNQGGTLAPGFSAGALSIVGNYTQQAAARLEVEIGGLASGSEFDVVGITGTATLAGAIDVSLIDGFMPAGGQQFTVLTASNIINNGLTITGPAASLFNLVVNGSSVVLQSISSTLDGDFNGDGTVDAADYTVWRNGLGTTYTPSHYALWKSHFGETLGSGGASVADTAVPEPATVWLLLLTAVFGPAATRRARLLLSARRDNLPQTIIISWRVGRFAVTMLHHTNDRATAESVWDGNTTFLFGVGVARARRVQ